MSAVRQHDTAIRQQIGKYFVSIWQRFVRIRHGLVSDW